MDKRVTIDSTARSLTISGETPEDNLPSPEVPGDAFHTLGAWEKATTLHKRGLTWAQVATKLISDCER